MVGSMVHESFSSCVPHLERNPPLLYQPLQTVHMSTLEGGKGRGGEGGREGGREGGEVI